MLTASPFFQALLERQSSFVGLPISERAGGGWHGLVLSVPPPSGADLSGPLEIESVGSEITVCFDHAHLHLHWPSSAVGEAGTFWSDPLEVVDAILAERLVAVSGWSGGKLRVGSLRETRAAMEPLPVSKLQHLRVRSWRGTFDHDEPLLDDA